MRGGGVVAALLYLETQIHTHNLFSELHVISLLHAPLVKSGGPRGENVPRWKCKEVTENSQSQVGVCVCVSIYICM